MPLSEARINANRENAKRSTGPRTKKGREASRKNAVKHGLCSKVVVTEDPAALDARAEEIAQALPSSRDGLDGWAAGQVALNSVRIERCQAMESAVRNRIVTRAQVTWDEDCRLEATVLGGTIDKRPEEVSAQLSETFHGCEWLLSRWAMLACSADAQGSWTPEQASLALDLLGTPPQFRQGHPLGTEIDYQGKVVSPAIDPAGLARRQIDLLIERRELLRPLDEAARQRAEADLIDDTDPELRKLRRYETALHRRMQWAYDLFQKLVPPQPSPANPEPEPKPEPKPETVARPATSPVENRTNPSSAPRSGSRKASRAEKKLIKAEARREARHRKLEKCLA